MAIYLLLLSWSVSMLHPWGSSFSFPLFAPSDSDQFLGGEERGRHFRLHVDVEGIAFGKSFAGQRADATDGAAEPEGRRLFGLGGETRLFGRRLRQR